MTDGTHDEALIRLHAFGPEFDGFLSNHGPMVVEAMSRRGAGADVHRWTDRYTARLDDAPRAPDRIDDWRESLGRRDLAGEWISHLRSAVAEHGWRDAVVTWWPRLLPGIAGGATHGVIRLGHALEAVRDQETQPRIDEVAHALAYWATCWLPAPAIRPTGRRTPGAVLADLPTVADQSGGIRSRLAQLGATDGYAAAAAQAAGATTADEVGPALERLVDDAVAAYARYAPGNPTMLVHAATAPNAVRMALPSLPAELALDSYRAAWSATTAVVAAYRPAVAMDPPPGPAAEDAFGQALAHGGEHVVKLADTALLSWRRTGDPDALSAIGTAIRLDA